MMKKIKIREYNCPFLENGAALLKIEICEEVESIVAISCPYYTEITKGGRKHGCDNYRSKNGCLAMIEEFSTLPKFTSVDV